MYIQLAGWERRDGEKEQEKGRERGEKEKRKDLRGGERMVKRRKRL